MVPGVIGYIPEYQGVTGTPPPPQVIGPHEPKWCKRRGGQGAAARPSPKSELDKEGGRRPPFLSPPLSFPLLS